MSPEEKAQEPELNELDQADMLLLAAGNDAGLNDLMERQAPTLPRLSLLEVVQTHKCLKIKIGLAKVCSHFPTLLSP